MHLRAYASNVSTPVIRDGLGAGFLPTSLASMGNACKCHYKGSCSCMASVEFLECISHACSTGLCDCKEQQYFHACTSLERACPSLGFECSGDTATCTATATAAPRPTGPPETIESVSEDLEALRKKKCELIVAHHDGWLNADERLAETEALIEKKIKTLQELGGVAPDMSCPVGASASRDAPAPERAPKRQAAPTKVDAPKPSAAGTGSVLSKYWWLIINLLIAILATIWIVHKHRQLEQDQQSPHCGIYSVLCCLCCSPATICFPIDARKA